MAYPEHVVVRLRDPRRVAPFTLAQMGRTAREASSTWTFREWAARLATRAPPRDYVRQLGQLYQGILRRWRYVAEPEEWIHGTARSAIDHVLGAKYNRGPTCPDPLRCDLDRTAVSEHGWGDCDDVATMTAAGALALGMKPVWRVVRWPGGAHVSTVVRTPRKQLVSVDPVGHPEHPFGWVLKPPGGPAPTYWNLEGQRIA